MAKRKQSEAELAHDLLLLAQLDGVLRMAREGGKSKLADVLDGALAMAVKDASPHTLASFKYLKGILAQVDRHLGPKVKARAISKRSTSK